ncbi:unnamed protein product [Closterium sp. NIES-54]
MTSLRSSGRCGDGGGGSSGSGGGCSSTRCRAVRWGVSSGGQLQLQRSQHETLSPHQLREWYARRSGGGGSSGSLCTAVQMGVFGGVLAQLQRRPRETLTPQQLRAWLNVGRLGVVLAARLHTLTIDSDASRCFFRDSTTLTPLSAPVPVRLADPSEGPVLARSSTVLPCPAVPSGSLPGLPLPSFSTNLVSTAALQDAMVTTTTPGGQRVSICTCTRTGQTWPQALLSAVRLQLRDRFREDLPVLRLHSDKCGSPQQNWIAERRIGLVMEVARTSMIHAAAPHFLWPFVVRYAAHQLNQWPHVSLPETLPTLGWTGKAGDPSVFGSGVLVPLFAIRLRTSSPPVLFPAGVELGGAESIGAGSGGAEPGGAELGGAEPVGVESGGAEPEGEEPGGAESGGAEPQCTSSSGDSAAGDIGAGGAGAGGTAVSAATSPRGARTRGTGAVGTGSVVGAGAGDPSEPGDAIARGTGAGGAGAGGAGAVGAGAGGTGAGGARAGGAGVVDPGAGGAGARGAVSGGSGAGGTVLMRLYFVPLLQQVLGVPSSPSLTPPSLCPLYDQSQPPLQPASTLPLPSTYTEQTGGLTEHCEPVSRPTSPVQTGHLVPRPRPPPIPSTHAMAIRPSYVPLRVPLPPPPESSLPAVPDLLWHNKSDRPRTTSPTVSRLLATVVIDPSFESTATSALVAELVDFAAARGLDYAIALVVDPGARDTAASHYLSPPRHCCHIPFFKSAAASASALVAALLDFAAACRLDYATALVAASESASPPSVGGECALGTDVLENRQEDFECLAAALPHFASMLLALEGDPDAPDILTLRSYAEAITGPYSSQWQAAMNAEMASWKSIRTYVHAVPPSRLNIVDGMWIFRVKRPLGSPPAFKARYVARGFSLRKGCDYELHSLDFSTAFLQGNLHEEIWLRRPPGFTGSFPAGTQWSLRRRIYGLRQAPREWHDTLRTILAALGFTPSTAVPSLFLRTDTSLPPFYVLVYIDDLVFAIADTQVLTLVKSELQKRHTCTDMAPPSDEYVELSGLYSELVGCLICEAEIYAGAMAALELRWLTYLLTNLGEQPRSPPVLYVDNKAMIALCQEHRLEHIMRHISLRYFLARELQQRGQLGLAYVATRANTADVFTKALPPGYSGVAHKGYNLIRPRTLPLQPCAPTLQPRTPPLPLASRLPAARSPPLQLAPRQLAARPLPLQPARRPLVARPPPLQPACRLPETSSLPLQLAHRPCSPPQWIGPRALLSTVHLQLRERFRADLPVLCLHSDRGGEFSSDLLQDICHGEGILQSFTLPASPQQNGIAERRIGLVMEVACTSMIHAAAPHFLWPYAHQLNLWPRVSLPETSPTLRWTGEVGNASVFQVRGSRAFVRDTSVDKLSAHAIPCVFLGFPPDAPGWQFYHPTSRRVLPSQDVTFDKPVPFYHLLPLRSAPLPSTPLFLAPGPPPVDPLPPQRHAPSGAVSGGAACGGAELVRAEPGGAKPEVVGSGGAEPGDAGPGGAESKGAESGGTEPERTEPACSLSTGGPSGVFSRQEPLSPPRLREWFSRRTRLRSGAAGAGGSPAGGTGAGAAGGTGAAGPGGARTGDAGAGGTAGVGAGGTGAGAAGGTGARAAGGTGATGPGGACTGGTGAAGAGGSAGVGAGCTAAGAAGGTRAGASGGTEAAGPGSACTGGTGATGAGGAAGIGARDPGAGDNGAGGTGPRPYFVPLLQQVLGLPSSPSLTTLPTACSTPYTHQTEGLIERRETVSRPSSPVCTVRTGPRVPRQRPPPVPGTHPMTLRPSFVPQRVPLPSPPASSLTDGPNPESDLVLAASSTVPRLLATFVSDPSLESAATSALVAELADFAAACRLNYATSLVAESESDCPPSVGGECALGTNVLEDREEDLEYFAAAVPHLVSMQIAPEGD